MVTKTMRQSSRSYSQRQALSQAHFGRTPQIHKKEMPKFKRTMKTTNNKGLSIWARLADWFKKLLGR
jgi:hypothetical protein